MQSSRVPLMCDDDRMSGNARKCTGAPDRCTFQRNETVSRRACSLRSPGIRLNPHTCPWWSFTGWKTRAPFFFPATYNLEHNLQITLRSDRAAAQGCYALEDEMNLNEVPGLAPGEIVRTARFSPRMIHSGLGPGMYPDEHLRAIAHAGMDAIIVDTSAALASPDACHAVNDVIRRAASFGIDVYTFSFFKNERHPSDPDAWAHYDAMHGRLFERCPDLKGIIFVGESCEFPSHDPRTTGRDYHSSKDDVKPSPGWFPCDDYPEFISLLRDVIHSHSPGAEIVFWSYNWGFLDAGPRLKLIEKLPTDVVLMATFEMFEEFDVAPGVAETCTDYTLWSIGPGPYFASESEAARKRGMKMYGMTNTGGNTWDIGVVPYLPAPQAWLKRFRAVVEAQEDWRLDGLMESHTYGYWPSMIPELAKQAFFEPMPDMDALLLRIVARDFGVRNAENVLRALQCFSEGVSHCVSTNQEQYGPCRIGPAYPLFFERTEPIPIGPQSIRNPNGTCVPVYRYSHDQAAKLLWETEEYAKMTTCFQEGCDMLEPVVKTLEADRRANAEELLGVARFIENTARTTVHVKRWHALKWKLGISPDPYPVWVGGTQGHGGRHPHRRAGEVGRGRGVGAGGACRHRGGGDPQRRGDDRAGRAPLAPRLHAGAGLLHIAGAAPVEDRGDPPRHRGGDPAALRERQNALNTLAGRPVLMDSQQAAQVAMHFAPSISFTSTGLSLRMQSSISCTYLSTDMRWPE